MQTIPPRQIEPKKRPSTDRQQTVKPRENCHGRGHPHPLRKHQEEPDNVEGKTRSAVRKNPLEKEPVAQIAGFPNVEMKKAMGQWAPEPSLQPRKGSRA